MPVEFLEKLNPEQQKKWTAFWNSCKHSHPEQHLLYGEVVRAQGRKPVFVFGEHNGIIDCIGIFSICPLACHRFSSEAICLRGPAFDEPSLLYEYLPQIISYFKPMYVGSIRISPYWYYDESEDLCRILDDLGFIPHSYNSSLINKIYNRKRVTHYVTSIIDICSEKEMIMDSFSKKTRRLIRKAQDVNIVIKTAKNLETVKEFYKHFSEMCLARSLNLPPFAEFENTYEYLFNNEDIGVLICAYYNDIFIGGVWVIRGPKYAHCLRLAVAKKQMNELGLNFSIAPILFWNGMLWAKEKGCQFFDLEGSSEIVSTSDHMFRIQSIKRGFNPISKQRLSGYIIISSKIMNFIHETQKLLSIVKRKLRSRLIYNNYLV